MRACPSACSCSSSSSSPGSSGRPTGATCCAARAVGPEAESPQPERVVVLSTLGAARAAELGCARASRRRARVRGTTPEPAPVATARATIVDPVSALRRAPGPGVAGRDRRRARDAGGRRGAQPRALRPPHRLRRPPHPRGLPRPGARDPGRLGRGRAGRRRALAARARAALDAVLARQRRRAPRCARRSAWRSCSARAARSSLCEELALRARLDLDQGRLAHAAIELDGASAAALTELRRGARRTWRAHRRAASELRAAWQRRRAPPRSRAAERSSRRRAAVRGDRRGRRPRTGSSAWKPRCAPARRRGSHARVQLEAMDPTRTAIGTWSGGRFMHFGEPLDDARLEALLRPGEGIDTRDERRRLRRRGGRPLAGRRR